MNLSARTVQRPEAKLKGGRGGGNGRRIATRDINLFLIGIDLLRGWDGIVQILICSVGIWLAREYAYGTARFPRHDLSIHVRYISLGEGKEGKRERERDSSPWIVTEPRKTGGCWDYRRGARAAFSGKEVHE